MKVSDDVLKSIGKVTLECTELETLIEIAIWKLIGRKGPIVTPHMNFPHKRDLLLALFEQEFPDNKEAHKSLSKELETAAKLFRKRNDLVHSTWNRDDPDTYLLRRARGKYQAEDIQTSATEIDQVTLGIQNLQKRLYKLLVSCGVWQLSWHDK